MKAEKDNAIKYSHGIQEVSLEAVLQPGNGITLHEGKNEMYHYVFFRGKFKLDLTQGNPHCWKLIIMVVKGQQKTQAKQKSQKNNANCY